MAVCCEGGEEQAERWWWGSTTTTDKQTSEQTDEHTHMHPFHLQRHRGIFTRTNHSADGSTHANICKYDWRECGLVSLGKLAAWFGAGAAICRLCSNSRPVKAPSSACHPSKNGISSDSLSFYLSQRPLYFHSSSITATSFLLISLYDELFRSNELNLQPEASSSSTPLRTCVAFMFIVASLTCGEQQRSGLS